MYVMYIYTEYYYIVEVYNVFTGYVQAADDT